eukprot:TRINITY_DN1435_c4_g1_i1.p1 TRINITY_DN1435_c4_g1~~TRINITY_DN1435_c4_g1_i1.p1  ORF type:complete len:331 (+),score=77.73 TRINITY_DN1435_c4_g1_i1:52-993(+)
MSLMNHLGDVKITSACEDPETGGAANEIIMAVLGLGTFLSYVPMIISVAQEKSSKGISLTSMLLVCVTNFASTVGVGLQNWQSVICCTQSKWSTVQCLEGLNPIFLIAANIIGCIPIYVLCVVYLYLPGSDAPENESQGSRSSFHSSLVPQNLLEDKTDILYTQERANLSLVLYTIWMLIVIAICPLLLATEGTHSDAIKYYADAMNILAGITIAVSWIPQIYVTYKAKDVGNLSIATILVQAPGAALVCISMMIAGQAITSILQNAVATVCLAVLLVLCIKYEYVDKRLKMKYEAIETDESDNEEINVGVRP